MKKHILLLAVASLFMVFLLNCTLYEVKGETGSAKNLKNFKQVHVSWLDLNENDHKINHFDNKEEWISVIYDANVKVLHKAFEKYFKNKEKKFTFAKSKSSKDPKKGGLFIKITLKSLYTGDWNFLTGVTKAKLVVNIQFIDIQKKETLYRVILVAYSDTGGFDQYSQAGRTNAAVDNMAKFIAIKLGYVEKEAETP